MRRHAPGHGNSGAVDRRNPAIPRSWHYGRREPGIVYRHDLHDCLNAELVMKFAVNLFDFRIDPHGLYGPVHDADDSQRWRPMGQTQIFRQSAVHGQDQMGLRLEFQTHRYGLG